jgi:hypothetical protein
MERIANNVHGPDPVDVGNDLGSKSGKEKQTV